MNKIIRGFFFALAVLPLAGTGYAADFNFTIPVNVTNLPPSIEFVSACCYVSQRNEEGHLGGGFDISGGYCSVADRGRVVGGAFHGDISVGVTVRRGKDPATAASYNCYLRFQGAVGGRNVTYFGRTMGALEFPTRSAHMNTGLVALPPR